MANETKKYKVTRKVRMANRFMTSLVKRGKTESWLLTTIGHSSGQRRTIPVTPVEVGGQRYLVAPYGAQAWVKNLRANPKATLQRGGASIRFTAEEVAPDRTGQVLSMYYAANEKYVGEYMYVPGDKTITDFTSVADRYPVFRVNT